MKKKSFTPPELAIYALIVGIVIIRFFTERLPMLPRVFNAFDYVAVPTLLGAWLMGVVLQRRKMRFDKPVVVFTLVFVIAWALSWVANVSDVHWIAGLLFPAGLLSPIVFYLIVTSLQWEGYFADRLLLVLVGLLLVNLAIGSVQALLSAGSGSPDIVYGTFGVNIDQFAFFLALMLIYIVMKSIYQRPMWFNGILLGWAGALFLIASFQMLWVLLPVSLVCVLFRARSLSVRVLPVAGVAAALMFFAWPVVPSTRFDLGAKLQEAVDDFNDLGKVELIENVPRVWEYRPLSVLFGVGPGTFNSRAFRSIADIPYAHYNEGVPVEDVSAAIMEPFYTSEVSERFIIPYFLKGFYRLSGPNTDAPFTSYVSIPIETGIPGAIAFFAIYGLILFRLDRRLRATNDPEQKVLAAWALTSMLMLLGLAVMDNALEVTRYTLLAWIPVILATIESNRKNRMVAATRPSLAIR